MPEDEVVVSEQVDSEPATEETVQDETAAFNEETKEDKAEEADLEDVSPNEQEEDSGFEDEEEEKPDAEKDGLQEPEPEKDLTEDGEGEVTAKSMVEERIAQRQSETEQVSSPKSQSELEHESEPADPAPLTKEQLSEHLKSFSLDKLPEGDIFIGDDIINIREFADTDPEQFNAVMVMSSIIAENGIKKAMAESQSASNALNEVQSEIKELRETNDFLKIDNAVSKKHNDWVDVVNSEKWGAWLTTKSIEEQSLAYSDDPQDGIAIIGLFKEENPDYDKTNQGIDTTEADEKLKEFDEKRKKNKGTFDSIHKTTARQSGPAKHASALTPEEEENDGFNSKDDDDDF